MVGKTCGRGRTKGIITGSGMELDYTLTLRRQAESEKQIEKNADHLSLERAGHPFGRQATAALRDLSPGAGRGHRPQPQGPGAVGIAGSGRTAPGPFGAAAAHHEAASTKKLSAGAIINVDFRAFDRKQVAMFRAHPQPSRIPASRWLLGQALYSARTPWDQTPAPPPRGPLPGLARPPTRTSPT